MKTITINVPVEITMTKKQAKVIMKADWGGIHMGTFQHNVASLHDSGDTEVLVVVPQLGLEDAIMKAAQEKLKS